MKTQLSLIYVTGGNHEKVSSINLNCLCMFFDF